MSDANDWIDGFRGIVGADQVLTDDGDKLLFEIDQTGRFVGTTPAVVLPGSIEEVAAVLGYCNAERIGVVPQGGNTGLVAGATPLGGEIVLSLRRLDNCSFDDPVVAWRAGTTLIAAQDAAATAAREVPLDIASRASATFGGMVATNAGGARSFRHGRMGEMVEELEVILASGEIVAGDLARQLGVGMEGTLGVIVGGTVRTVPQRYSTVTALASFGSLGELLETARALHQGFDTLEVAEYMGDPELDLVRRVLELPEIASTKGPFHLLLEWADEDIDRVASALYALGSEEALVARSKEQQELLWAYRDLVNEALRLVGPPLKLDISIPPEELGALIVSLHRSLPGRRVHAFGHLLVGHIHLNVLSVEGHETDELAEIVLKAVLERGGHIRGEHGVGRAKSRWLDLAEENDGIVRFRELKERYDPNGILNPEVIVPVYPSG